MAGDMARPVARKANSPLKPVPMWGQLGYSRYVYRGGHGPDAVETPTALPMLLAPLAQDPEFTHQGVSQCGRCGVLVTVKKRRTPSKLSRLAAKKYWVAGFSGGLLLSIMGVMVFFAQMRGATDGTPGMLTTAFTLSGLFFLWLLTGVIGEIVRDWGFACEAGNSGDVDCTHVARMVDAPKGS
ncbi:hypothetical protein AB0F17_50710 [Nonomuraea sp. NPDC026600]|uniref:hypothetical protein n=1 Tax=Nonomuraea sp. NPDC026600 TaxID=3155363 RepID=UPI0033E581C3